MRKKKKKNSLVCYAGYLGLKKPKLCSLMQYL